MLNEKQKLYFKFALECMGLNEGIVFDMSDIIHEGDYIEDIMSAYDVEYPDEEEFDFDHDYDKFKAIEKKWDETVELFKTEAIDYIKAVRSYIVGSIAMANKL